MSFCSSELVAHCTISYEGMAPLSPRGLFCNWSAMPKSKAGAALWRLRKEDLVGRKRISQIGFLDHKTDCISGTLLKSSGARRIREKSETWHDSFTPPDSLPSHPQKSFLDGGLFYPLSLNLEADLGPSDHKEITA